MTGKHGKIFDNDLLEEAEEEDEKEKKQGFVEKASKEFDEEFY